MARPTDVHIGRRVREARAAHGFSQSSLSEKLGVSFQQVQKYENGTNRISGSRLWDIATVLGLPITYFFDGLTAGGPPSEGLDEGHPVLLRKTIKLAREIESIGDPTIRHHILELIRAAAKLSSEGREAA